MFDGTSFKILFILLVFWFGGCGDAKIQVSQTECVASRFCQFPVQDILQNRKFWMLFFYVMQIIIKNGRFA